MTVTFSADPDDREPPATRARFERVYMGEGIPDRCSHCYMTSDQHELTGTRELYCFESYLRMAGGDR